MSREEQCTTKMRDSSIIFRANEAIKSWKVHRNQVRQHGDLISKCGDAGQLSVGEAQRLAVARLLLRRPVLAVLDEATSAVGDAAALELHRLIRGTGAAVLTLAQCQSPLREVHDAVVAIGHVPGSWHWVSWRQ